MEDLAELRAMCEALRTECIKFFEEGNKTAGTRARKMLQQIKGKAQELRVSIQETKRQMEVVRGSEAGLGVGGAGAAAGVDAGAGQHRHPQDMLAGVPGEGATVADPTHPHGHHGAEDMFDAALMSGTVMNPPPPNAVN